MSSHEQNISEILVSLTDVAKFAKTSKSAVSNWRKRYKDFPVPRVEQPSGALFDLAEVEEWLIKTGRLTSRVPQRELFWNVASSLRDQGSPDQISRFVIALILYVTVCERAAEAGSDLKVEPRDSWQEVSKVHDWELMDAVARAVHSIENANPQLERMISVGLERLDFRDRRDFGKSIRVIAANAEHRPGLDESDDLFDEVFEWRESFDRFLAESSTPNDLAILMSLIAASFGPRVFDPAAGDAGVLLLTAQMHDAGDARTPEGVKRQGGPRELLGYEVNPSVLWLARARMFLYGQKATLEVTNSLLEPSVQGVAADVVVVDPPFGMKDWGDARTILDPRWEFGGPPARSADFAWLQVAWQALRPGGVALVLLPQGSLFRQGAESEIRRNMLRAGAVSAIVSLPAKMRTNTSIKCVLWVLQRPETPTVKTSQVLLIDATDMGKPGRRQHDFASEELEAIADVVVQHAYGLAPDPLSKVPLKLVPSDPQLAHDLSYLMASVSEAALPLEAATEDASTLRTELTTAVVELDRALGVILTSAEEER